MEVFSTDYLKCSTCETLVLAEMPDPRPLLSVGDEHGFYGRHYFESHVPNDLGLPGIDQRARTDLEDRCAHWLRTLLKYKLPPASVLELGCAHGGFVALMRWAGFDASGLEMSSWLASFAKQTFEVPMLVGPIERQDIEPSSLDAIILMDLLEHLRDPAGTLQQCLGLLKPQGILVIQTPEYREGKTLAEMQAHEDRFLQLLAPEHLFLFSKKSVREFLARLGVSHLQFEPAAFSFYDMFLVASRAPLSTVPHEKRQAALGASPSQRLALALVGIDRRLGDYQRWHAESEADRAYLRERIEQLEGSLSRQLSGVRSANAAGTRLERATELLTRLARSQVYRAVRRLGLWEWLERGIDEVISQDDET